MAGIMPGCWQLCCKISKAGSQDGESQVRHLAKPEGELEPKYASKQSRVQRNRRQADKTGVKHWR